MVCRFSVLRLNGEEPEPSHKVFVTGVPESIHRYLDLSLAAARLARAVLWTGLEGGEFRIIYIPCPDKLCLVKNDTIPSHLGKQTT